jgi:hypothetical protein
MLDDESHVRLSERFEEFLRSNATTISETSHGDLRCVFLHVCSQSQQSIELFNLLFSRLSLSLSLSLSLRILDSKSYLPIELSPLLSPLFDLSTQMCVCVC